METPELDKLAKVNDEGNNQIIGEFLEWAQYSGYHFTKTVTVQVDGWREGETYDRDIEQPVSIEEALAHYFGIDMDKVRAEREALYAELRKASVCQRGAQTD